MKVRVYGESQPIKVAVIHGGPGAPGYMAPVARELAKDFGVLEPIQSSDSMLGQLEELNSQLLQNSDRPLTLVGSSWGATLSLLYTSRFPSRVSKIILIGSCVYDSKYTSKIRSIRSERMSEEAKRDLESIQTKIESVSDGEKNDLFRKAADYYFESDVFDPITRDLEIIECQFDLNSSVWKDFVSLRESPEELKSLFSKIKVPVVNIHGDYDPHVIDGIQPFLESCIAEVRLHSLESCGHYPWIERKAMKRFFEVLRNELKQEP